MEEKKLPGKWRLIEKAPSSMTWKTTEVHDVVIFAYGWTQYAMLDGSIVFTNMPIKLEAAK